MVEEIFVDKSEVPLGGSKIIRVKNFEVGIFNVRGTYSAIVNWCPQEGGPICSGYVTGTVTTEAENGWIPRWVRDGEIVCCPWHGYEFDIRTGKCLTRKGLQARTFVVEMVDDKLKIEL